MILNIICAIGPNLELGNEGDLPWDFKNYPEDMEHFKKITKGKNIVMGKKTWESLPSYPNGLKYRHNIILTSDKTLKSNENITFIHSTDELCKWNEVYIIGGKLLIEWAFNQPELENIYITNIHQSDLQADVFLNNIPYEKWICKNKQNYNHCTINHYAPVRNF